MDIRTKYMPELYARNPTKLSYCIEYSSQKQSFRVIQKAVLDCLDVYTYLDYIQTKCKPHFKSFKKFVDCYTIASEAQPLKVDLVPFEKAQMVGKPLKC